MDFWIVAKFVSSPPSQRWFTKNMLQRSGFFRDGILGLALGSDKENDFSLGCEFGNELGCFFEEPESLLKIDDVDSVALAEDVLLHLRIPALGLVPEVNAGFQKFLHCNRRQINLRVQNFANVHG